MASNSVGRDLPREGGRRAPPPRDSAFDHNMALFIELPDELVPFILQFIAKPQQLALVSLVNKLFYASVTPILYERISIFSWHKDSKKKVRFNSTICSLVEFTVTPGDEGV